MRIITPGKPEIAKVLCRHCECEFEAYKFEFQFVSIADSCYYDINCPCCKKALSLKSTELIWERKERVNGLVF